MTKTLFVSILCLGIGLDFGSRVFPKEKLVVQEVPTQIIIEVPQTLEVKLYVTAYTLSSGECNSDLKHKATMRTPVVGRTAAVSRDHLYLLGKEVYVEKRGMWLVTDVMNERWSNRLDLLVDKKTASTFKNETLKVVPI